MTCIFHQMQPNCGVKIHTIQIHIILLVKPNQANNLLHSCKAQFMNYE